MLRSVASVALFGAICLVALLCPHSPCQANRVAAPHPAAAHAQLSAQHRQALILALMVQAHHKHQQAHRQAPPRLATHPGHLQHSHNHFRTNSPKLTVHAGNPGSTPKTPATAPAAHPDKSHHLAQQGLSPRLAQALAGDHKKADWHPLLKQHPELSFPRHSDHPAPAHKLAGPVSHEPKDVAHWLRQRFDHGHRDLHHDWPRERRAEAREHRDWMKNPVSLVSHFAHKDQPASHPTPASSASQPTKVGDWVRNSHRFEWQHHPGLWGHEHRFDRWMGERDPFRRLEFFFRHDPRMERLLRFEDRMLHHRLGHHGGHERFREDARVARRESRSQKGGAGNSPLADSFGIPPDADDSDLPGIH